ncbi:thiopeptide-type bacteriocin biosynthesis domain-containing protein [Mucilaginibacter mallensis]|uniref:Thiopeptide-type bacteriocin biosynthesis domain-containing protein n=1 Tax=Mucilaginibacter mallensis TaxID=652787 RepID=A0A1H1WQK5_MUCMA|nr:lantibiotic dehydratase [Mucilaginibacter mallensis]SDS98911.1 thiopeptide-type bacteriocin biosynthesis domain-containing protein [Mucilaginibacter mallensis]
MLNVCFSPYLFLRTPALSYDDYNSSMLEEMLNSQFFQAAIFFASESLYMELSRCNFNYQSLDKKVKLSLQKYFNRMCYRPTPFGMFSAFSSHNWSDSKNTGPCVLDNEKHIYVNPDFQFTVNIAKKMEKSAGFSNVKYYSNNAIYTIKDEKRYLTSAFDLDQEKTDFLISSYKADRLLNKLMSFCKDGKTKIELITWLDNLIDDKDDAVNYIADLVEAGLLVSELYPNMIGEKYFNRLASIAARNTKNKFTEDILAYEKLISSIKQESDVNIKHLTQNSLYLHPEKKLKSMFYVGYERMSQSLIDRKYQDYIKDGLNCLNKLTFGGVTKSLVNFKSKFKARFEDQEIPILLALDRESGIGYEGLEANLATSELLDGIQLDLQSNSLNFSWTPVHEFFLSKLSKNKNEDYILISDRDLEKIQTQSELKCPPSFSVLFRIFDNKIWMEQAGGCTSAAILGRFTLFSERVLEEARYVVSMEEKINKEVVFAEISCFNDEHAANINSSAGIRAYEIPIGVHSTLSRENIINLSDITVSVVDDDIILRSKKLNRIIVPRLSSAYNYSRSELSIFRFLCDLQHQGLKSNFNLDLKSLLPGLNFYPRVEYKNCILFPSTWILGNEEITEIVGGNDTKGSFQKLSEKIRLQKFFALTEGDNQLIFDRDNAESIIMFITVIKNKSSVVLQEVFLDQSTFVGDQTGKPLIGQFAASIYSNDIAYYQNTLAPLQRKSNKIKRVYLPGDEWIYLKLYCHPAISNNLLTKNIKSLVTWLKKQHILKNWYFIRYADPDNHLRVRVQINPNDGTEVLKYFEKKIRHQVEKGSVNNLLLDTYKREIERYGEYTIEYVEKVFQVSSELILAYLKNIFKVPGGYSELHLAIISVNAMLETFFHENARRITLLKCIHESMKHEFDDSKQVKFQLDNKYREHSFFINNMEANREAIIVITGKKEFNNYLKALELLRSNTGQLTDEKLTKLVADLIHMHLNRLFNEKQRKQEFIIYYLLYKYYLSVEARKGKMPLVLPPAPKGHSIDHANEAVFK